MPRPAVRIAAVLSGCALVTQLALSYWGPAALPPDTDWVVRLLPAIAGAALLLLVTDATRHLGGTPAAQALAGIAVLANPVYLRHTATMPLGALDEIWWTLGLYGILRVALDDRQTWWAAVGLAIAGAVTLAVFGVGGTLQSARLPWPLHALMSSDWHRVSPLDFLRAQLVHGPALVLAAVGAWRFLRDRAGSGVRAVGLACVVAFAAGLLLDTETYSVTPVYPLLIAAGASWWSQRCERWFDLQGRAGVHGVSIAQVVWTITLMLAPVMTGSA